MPRYITPGDKVQFFEHTDEGGGEGGNDGGEGGEALPELTEYTEAENEVTFNPAENEIREYKPTEPPVNVNTAFAGAGASASAKKKSGSKEMFFFFALILIIFGISIFFKR
jgi:hypothetical protein